MKIFKLILLIGILGSTPITYNRNNNNNNIKQSYNSTSHFDPNLKDNSTLDNLTAWYKNANVNNINLIKNYINDNVKVSIIKINNLEKNTYILKDNFNESSLNKFVDEKVITQQIKNILLSPMYLKNLTNLINTSNIVTINSNNTDLDNNFSIKYNGDINENSSIDNKKKANKKVWVVSHWYWMGYWKLCIDHEASQKLANYLVQWNTITRDEVADFLTSYYLEDSMPDGSTDWLSTFLYTNGLIIQSNDLGAGVWIGFYIILPDMGWGSLTQSIDPITHKAVDNRLFWDKCKGWGYDENLTHNFNILDYTNYGNFENYVELYPTFRFDDYTSIVYKGKDNSNEKHQYKNWTNWSNIQFNTPIVLDSYIHNKGLAKYSANLYLTWLNINGEIIASYNFRANNSCCLSSTSSYVSYTKIEFN